MASLGGPPGLLLAAEELLPAVNIVGRAGEGRVGHDVYGERGDVGRSDDAPDGKRGAKLIAAVLELIAEERCRQRRVDEAGGDEVDPDGRELECQVGCQGGECGGDCRRDPEADAWGPATGAAHEQKLAPITTTVCPGGSAFALLPSLATETAGCRFSSVMEGS